MTIHRKIMKRYIKVVIVVICLFLSIFALITCLNRTGKINKDSIGNKDNIPSKSTAVKGGNQIIKDDKISKITFEKNNNVYIYDEVNKQIKSIGDNSKSKDLSQLSPDKTKIVFRYFDEKKATYPPHIVIYDIKTEGLTDIVIKNKNVQQIIELDWIDNENMLVTGHINPSVSGYAVYSIKSKAELMSCVGTIRDVTINNKNILYSSTPHIFPQPRANLYLNSNKIFEISNIKEQIFDGIISNDGTILAFRSWVEEDKNLHVKAIAYLNVAKIDSDGKSINNLQKIVIGSDTTGELKFDDKNNINIIGEKYIYKLKDGKLINIENTLSKKTELTKQQLTTFKEVLAKKFPEDDISNETVLEDVDIYNMISF